MTPEIQDDFKAGVALQNIWCILSGRTTGELLMKNHLMEW